MDLKEIRDELRKLSELVGGWPDLESASTLEKDWALEKLRAIYEVVRFGAGQTSGAKPEAGPTFGEPEAGTSGPEVPRVVEAAEDVLPVAQVPVEKHVAEPQTVRPAVVVETEEEVQEPVVSGSEVRHAVEVAAPVPESAVPDELEVVDLNEMLSLETEAAAEPDIDPALEVIDLTAGSEEEPDAKAAPEPVVPEQKEPVVPEQTEPAAPTLFGLDDKMERHRHKQRVIMSLYDTAPAETEEPFAASASRSDSSEPARRAAVSGRPRPAGADPEIVLLDAYTEEPVEEPRLVHAADPAAPTQAAEYFVPDGDAGPEEEPAPEMLEPQSAHIEVLQDDLAVPAGAVLGEVINHDVQTLADTIVSPGFGRYGEPISDLRQAIGINDKFSMIRDLFGGDSDLFETTIAALNAQPGLDDCMIYIAERFAWNPDSESAKLMMELLERKFA
ncbi:MAG: hypothetical protein K2N04_02750 [Alistipes sp.]|nr:hypothetical protein [Alistipes sp.]